MSFIVLRKGIFFRSLEKKLSTGNRSTCPLIGKDLDLALLPTWGYGSPSAGVTSLQLVARRAAVFWTRSSIPTIPALFAQGTTYQTDDLAGSLALHFSEKRLTPY
jgi:hypothetical protein